MLRLPANPWIVLTTIAVAVGLLSACGTDDAANDGPEEVSWAAERDLLEDEIEARLDAIDDVMDRVESRIEEDRTPALNAKQTELEELRDALRDDLAQLDEQTMTTWPEFMRSVEARMELTEGRLDAMRESLG